MQTIQLSKLDTASKVIAALKGLDKKDFIAAKVWTGGDKVRVYTGARGEYYDIADEGQAVRCRKNMTWSHLLGDAMRAQGVTEVF